MSKGYEPQVFHQVDWTTVFIFHYSYFWFCKICLNCSKLQLETSKSRCIFQLCSLMSHFIFKFCSQTWQSHGDLCDSLCGIKCSVKCLDNILRTNENHKTLAKKHQDFVATQYTSLPPGGQQPALPSHTGDSCRIGTVTITDQKFAKSLMPLI